MAVLLPWLIVCVLVLALGVGVYVGIMLRRASDDRTRVLEEQHSAGLADERERSAAALQELGADHRRQLDEQDARQRKAVVELERLNMEAAATAAMFQTALAQSIGWDRRSRDVILRACGDLGMDAVLVTNIVFPVRRADGAQYMAQIDHLLLTATGALLIEAKYWKGTVFDGIAPVTVHRGFAPLAIGRDISGEFALQLRGLDKRGRFEADPAPRKQVRTQAVHLRDYVAERLGASPWFDTCVFYSHPDVDLYAAEPDDAPRSGATPALDERGLTHRIRAMRDSRNPQSTELSSLAGLFRALGADVSGVGSFSAEWTSAIPR